MSSTKITDVRIFRLDVPETAFAGHQVGFLPATTAIICFERSCCTNVFPQVPRWKVSFIGCEDEFSGAFLPYMERVFEDGLLNGPWASGKAFAGHLSHAAGTARTLKCGDLWALDHSRVSWAVEDASCLEDLTGLYEHEYLGMRWAMKINNDEDMRRMVENSLLIKGRSPKGRDGNIWEGRVWQHDYAPEGKPVTRPVTEMAA